MVKLEQLTEDLIRIMALACIASGASLVHLAYVLAEECRKRKMKKKVTEYLLMLDEREMRRYIQEVGLP